MNFDVLPHILALGYLCRIWSSGVRGGPQNVFGAYPGLELIDDTTKQGVAEADVAFILANGNWIVGECKTTAVELQESDLTKLWNFADRVDAPATFVATLESSANCGEIWKRTTSPSGRPHFALTAEHLYDRGSAAQIGDDTLAWRTGYRTPDRTVESVISSFARYIHNADTRTRRRAPWMDR